MTVGRWRLAFGSLYVLVLTVGLALGLWVTIEGYSPVPFADFWSEFPFIERGVRGNVNLADLWAQHNEHRIIVARLQFLLDYRFFNGTNVFLFAMIVTSCLVLAGTFATAVWLDTRDWLLTLGTVSVSVVSTLSPVGIENLTWAFQVQFVQVFLLATVSVLAVVSAARSASTRRQVILTAAAAIAAIGATYSMANGLLTWVVITGLALVLRLERHTTAALAVVGMTTIGSFFWHFEFSTRGSLSDPIGLVNYTAIYLGSAFSGSGKEEAALVGGVALALFLLLCVVAWKRRSGASILLPFGTGVAAFVVLTAAQTAAGRLDVGTQLALSSRYTIGSFTFWLALLVGFLTPLRERLRAHPTAAPAYLACAAVAFLFVAYRALPPSEYLPSLVVGKETTVLAYRVGVEDGSGTTTGGPTGPVVVNSLRWMEDHGLGPWATGGMVDDLRVTGPIGTTSLSCRGAVEWNEPVRGGRRLRGWIAAPEGEAASREFVVLGPDGRRRGLGIVGTYRPDVREAGASESKWTGFTAYVLDQPSTPLVVVLVAGDRQTPACRLAVPDA